jgi:hypothetical protein
MWSDNIMIDTPNGYEPDFDPSPEHSNGLQGFTTVGEFLAEDGWNPQRIDQKFVYRTYYYGKNGEFRCYAQVRVDLQQFIFYAVATLKVPEDLRLAVAEYITRANYGLRIGNFEMDFSDGEVRYKSGIDFEDATITTYLIRNTVYPAVHTMDHYMPGLMKVIYGGVTPLVAIEEMEQ